MNFHICIDFFAEFWYFLRILNFGIFFCCCCWSSDVSVEMITGLFLLFFEHYLINISQCRRQYKVDVNLISAFFKKISYLNCSRNRISIRTFGVRQRNNKTFCRLSSTELRSIWCSKVFTYYYYFSSRGTWHKPTKNSIINKTIYNKGNGGISKMFFSIYNHQSSSNVRELMKIINNQRKLRIKKHHINHVPSFFLKNQQQVNSIKITENIII